MYKSRTRLRTRPAIEEIIIVVVIIIIISRKNFIVYCFIINSNTDDTNTYKDRFTSFRQRSEMFRKLKQSWEIYMYFFLFSGFSGKIVGFVVDGNVSFGEISSELFISWKKIIPTNNYSGLSIPLPSPGWSIRLKRRFINIDAFVLRKNEFLTSAKIKETLNTKGLHDHFPKGHGKERTGVYSGTFRYRYFPIRFGLQQYPSVQRHTIICTHVPYTTTWLANIHIILGLQRDRSLGVETSDTCANSVVNRIISFTRTIISSCRFSKI